jgi:hypothetical protein
MAMKEQNKAKDTVKAAGKEVAYFPERGMG